MPVRKLLYTMSLPLMVSLLVQSLYNIVDSMFVARLSEEALAATALVYAVQFLMIAIGVGTAVGLNALLSRTLGQGEVAAACRVATTGLVVMSLSAAIFSLAGIFCSPQIAHFLTSDPSLVGLCEDYLSVNLVFCWGIFLQTYGQRLLQAVGDTFLSMVSLIVGAVLNIILDPILIFGYLGAPAMGIRGAAIATVIGQMVGAVCALGFNRWKNPSIHVRLRGYRFLWSDVVAIYRIGLPTIVMQALGSVMTFVVNGILLEVSTTAVAFFGVYYRLQNFLMMPMNGLGQAAIPIVGFNFGSGNHARIRETWRVLMPTGLVFAVCATVIFWLCPGGLMALFAASSEMQALGVPALRIISLTFPLATTTMLCGYFATGLGNGTINMISGALRQLVLLAPGLAVGIRLWGIGGAWYAFWLAEGVAFCYSLWRTRRLMAQRLSSDAI